MSHLHRVPLPLQLRDDHTMTSKPPPPGASYRRYSLAPYTPCPWGQSELNDARFVHQLSHHASPTPNRSLQYNLDCERPGGPARLLTAKL
mmetsp:Transcript_35296/g.92633  ORF Transcript_35296/g.92633 Transcript_35296/m.92633 type:complete len:90 (-) Transcript_35296:887-1156(-)